MNDDLKQIHINNFTIYFFKQDIYQIPAQSGNSIFFLVYIFDFQLYATV